MSIKGINVQLGNGGLDYAERMHNLNIAKAMEEEERGRRMKLDRKSGEFLLFNDLEETGRFGRSLELEEVERHRRCHDLHGESHKKKLAHELSSLVPVNFSSGLSTTFQHAGEKAASATLLATETAKDLGHKAYEATQYATETAKDLSGKAWEQAHALQDAATEKTSELIHQVEDSGFYLAHQAKDTASAVFSTTAEMLYGLAGKAAESVSSVAETGKALAGHALESVSSSFSEASKAAVEAASETVESLQFFAKDATEEVFDNDLGKLTTWENEEREYRMSPTPIMDRFLLALKASDIIKDWQGYKWEDAPNRHYATAVMESYERKRRFQQDEEDQTAINNAKEISALISQANFKAEKRASKSEQTLEAPKMQPFMVKTELRFPEIHATGMPAM